MIFPWIKVSMEPKNHTLDGTQKSYTIKWHFGLKILFQFQDISTMERHPASSLSCYLLWFLLLFVIHLFIDEFLSILFPAAVKLFWSSFSLKFWTSFCHSLRFDPLVFVWVLSVCIHCLTCMMHSCSYLDLWHVHVSGSLGIHYPVPLLFFVLLAK